MIENINSQSNEKRPQVTSGVLIVSWWLIIDSLQIKGFIKLPNTLTLVIYFFNDAIIYIMIIWKLIDDFVNCCACKLPLINTLTCIMHYYDENERIQANPKNINYEEFTVIVERTIERKKRDDTQCKNLSND